MNDLFKLTVDGIDITDTIADRLVSLSVTDERDGAIDQLDIEISNSDFGLAMPKPKAALKLWLADINGDLVDMGDYHVDTVELDGRMRTITITARSADVTESLKVRREISYESTTVGGILDQIASRNSLELIIAAVLAAIPIDYLDQIGESDLSLIQRLGELYDAVATIKSGRIVFKPAGTADTATGSPLPAVEIALEDGPDWRLRLESSSYTGVNGYWNEEFGELRQVISVGTDIYPLNIGGTFRTEALCRAAVESRWKQLQRAQSSFRITLPYLNPYAIPDSPIAFAGEWPEEVSQNDMIIRRVVHRIPATTEIEAELKTA